MGKVTGQNRWGIRHYHSWRNPGPKEIVVRMIEAAADYADWHKDRYESKIGEDGVIGKEWETIVRACLGLLNGELGDLDGGTLDGLLRDMLRLEGFDPND